ncbi:MAG: hypothetical protein IJS28_01010 [Synergistaceae bacterium]|nr:hypothetical protein [Synergistaceae bacterium]
MKILAADSKLSDLSELLIITARLLPDAEIMSSLTAEDTIRLASAESFSAVLLDDGLGITEKLRTLSPETRIILTHKPISREEISRELREWLPRRKLYVQTFGGFSLFVDGKPLIFRRAKTKELLAVLVDRRGGSVSVREACALLFEDKAYDISQGGYFRVLVSDLMKTLKDERLEGIIRKSRNNISVDIKAFECDAYNFLKGDPEAIRNYNGDYMICYGWAEYSSELFNRKISGTESIQA